MPTTLIAVIVLVFNPTTKGVSFMRFYYFIRYYENTGPPVIDDVFL